MGTLVCVMAHPDDDAYGIAGSVALLRDDPAFRFVMVHATDGGAGDIREGFPATRETLGAVRRGETAAAWRAVGRVPDRHEWLGYPDGELANVSFEELSGRVEAILAEERATVVPTFGPDGIFGHPDHITIGAATDAAFLRLVERGQSSLKRLCHGIIPESVFSRWNSQRLKMGLRPFDPTAMYHMRGVPDEEVDITIDTSPVSKRVVAGLLEHRSQHHVIIDDPTDVERWERIVTREWWSIAWPDYEGPMLAGLFEALPDGE
ncbi:PIG-L deacetylase family protein [Catelliglobosispora koreensis]|uniref:PIG-L deacetylase family protein n=1 Tax=Catelliglobosispora koreensis TaxID=129052 RepID=UPI00036A8258|nr:PIG-L family deacetylase [Catelliglobosispora koreensis]